jgi:mannitol 2-dehydrogenase
MQDIGTVENLLSDSLISRFLLRYMNEAATPTLLPVIREQIAVEGPSTLSAAIVASWARYAEGVDEQGNTITVVDNVREDVVAAASAQPENALAFIENRNFFGGLAQNKIFANANTAGLVSIFDIGAHAALEAIVQEE